MTYELHLRDCLEYMKSMPDNSVDSIVTDPPYGLKFMGEGWDKSVPGEAFWIEALRIAKPGAHLLSFGGTRTYHRLVCAIEDAGWEIRDTIAWVYCSGFPKSHNISKAIDKVAGAEREVVGRYQPPGMDKPRNLQNAKDERTVPLSASSRNNLDVTSPSTPEAQQWDGWGTALKPAFEPICVARKPLIGTVVENVLQYGTGGINIDGCRVEGEAWKEHDAPGLARTFFTIGEKPIIHKQPHSLGRFPANFIHDGSEEVLDLFPQSAGQQGDVLDTEPGHTGQNGIYGNYERVNSTPKRNDTGSAARIFYCPKASKRDRDEGCDEMQETDIVTFATANGTSGKPSSISAGRNTKYRNTHPTVKPTDLMRYLCRLVTPPEGVVFDPFTGSGSTGKAAMLEGFNFIGCDNNPDYLPIAERRIKHAQDKSKVTQGELL